MNLRLPAVAALILGLAAAISAPVAWPIAVVLGLGAGLLGVLTLTRHPVQPELGFAIGGLVLAVAAVVLGAVVALAGGDSDSGSKSLSYVSGIATATPDDAHPPQLDVVNPLPCRAEIGALRAGGTITNHSPLPADYTIIVVWEDDGTRLASNTAVVTDVPPSLTRNFEVSAAGEGTILTRCRVERIDRVVSGGDGSSSTRPK